MRGCPLPLLERLAGSSPVHLTRDELEALISSAETVREERTGIAGALRVLALDGSIFVQEITPAGEVLVRPRRDLAEAFSFVDRRMQTYDRMWDG